MNKLLPIILASLCLAAPLQAQSVTWGAIGLPPGLSISSVNGTTAKISGVPTTPGNYNTIVFPKIGNAVGHMREIPISILSAGSDLPIYHGYNRINSAIAGGSGYVLARDGVGNAFFSTDGVNYKQVSLPPGKKASYSDRAAIAGSRCIIIGDNSWLAYSDNRTDFKALNIPDGATRESNHSCIFSNGTNRFFYINSIDNDGFFAMNIWSMQANQLTWSKRGTITLANGIDLTNYASMNNAFLAANGSMLVLATSYYDVPLLLLYSTNGGDTWIALPSNPSITSVAYGNDVFLGSGPNGLWKSTNGIDWQKISSNWYGKLVFSSNEKLFFSYKGVSKTGTEWVAYFHANPSWSGTTPVTTNTGVILLGRFQLIPMSFPSCWEKGSDITFQKAIVGKPLSANITP